MFDTIVESVLNEISAEDAYAKFYSIIPMEEFNGLIAAYGGKFDTLIKTIFNGIKSRLSSVIEPNRKVVCSELCQEAKEFLADYKKAPNEVRIKFNQNLKSGEYEDVLDMKQGLKELLANGVDTVKSIQNLGLVTVIDDDNYRLTCTATYEANHHFYGKSRWCTASDRLGNYDGWEYFVEYVFDIDADIIDDIENFNIDKHPPVASLVQFTNKKTNKTYQMQLFGDASVGQACDFEDDSCEVPDMGMPEDIMDIIQMKAKEFIEITKEAQRKEFPYQQARNEYVAIKRSQNRERVRELVVQYTESIQESVKQKIQFIKTKFNELIDSNLLKNPKFINQLCKNSKAIYDKERVMETEQLTYNELVELEELLKLGKYALVSNIKPSDMNVVAIKISPIIGMSKDIAYLGNNVMPSLIDSFVFDSYKYENEIRGGIVVFAKTSTESAEMGDIEVESVLKISQEQNINIQLTSLYNIRYDGANYTEGSDLVKYFSVEHSTSKYDQNGYTEIFYAKTFNSIKLKGTYSTAFIYDDLLLLQQNLTNIVFVFNKETLEYLSAITVKRIDPRGYGWLFGKDEKTEHLYILSDELIDMGRPSIFSRVDFSYLGCEYSRTAGGLFIIKNYDNGNRWGGSEEFLYDKNTHKGNIHHIN